MKEKGVIDPITNNKHILMIRSNAITYDPRVTNEANTLRKAGLGVTIIGWDRRGEHSLEEETNGYNIIRVRNTKVMEFLPYDIFRLRFWWKEAYKKTIKLHERHPIDAVHCADLDTLPTGVMLKKRYNIPLVYDVYDVFGWMVARDLPKWWANYYLWKEEKLIKHADRIITTSEPFRRRLEQISDVPITMVYNCKPLISEKYQAPENNVFTIMHIGTLNKSRFILELIDVVKKISDIHCIIGGIGKPSYVSAVKEKCSDVSNVDFVGKVPMDDVIPMTKKVDVVVCMTDPNDPNNSRALANKQFEAMVCGRPIICTKGTYPGEFTEKKRVGLTADFKKDSLEEAIIRLRDNEKLRENLGKRALATALREYNWKKQEDRLLKMYNDL